MDDEVTMIKDLLAMPAEPPAALVHGAWERLEQQMRGVGGPDPAQRGAPPAGRSRRRALTRPLLLGGVATGAAAALAVGVLAAVHSGPRQPVAAARPPVRHSPAAHPSPAYVVTQDRPLGTATGQPAGPVLTAVATSVARQSASSGPYWCNVDLNALIAPIGPAATELVPPGQGAQPSPVSDYRYTIASQSKMEACFEPGRIGMVAASNQNLGSKPATPADVAAWRAAGSPAYWHAWYGHGQRISRTAGPVYVSGGKPGQGGSLGDGVRVPVKAAKLRAALLAEARGQTPASIWRSQSPQATAEALFGQARTLLLSPLTPAQRSADYQVLAGIPGLRTQPNVKDPSGRVGTAMWMGSPTSIIIVDPSTGMLLADEWLTSHNSPWVYAPGTVTQYNLWTTAWTSTLP